VQRRSLSRESNRCLFGKVIRILVNRRAPQRERGRSSTIVTRYVPSTVRVLPSPLARFEVHRQWIGPVISVAR
jgi:hypothetical protein